jgi:sugar lactone lactonase YvrE
MKPLLSTLTILLAALFLSLAAGQEAPATIALPDGFRPEGIAAGEGNTIYAGSLADGAIYQADVSTGEGSVAVPGEEGRVTAGLAFDERSGYLYAAGARTGSVYVFDPEAGTLLATFSLTDGDTFVNDAVISGDSVYITDSGREVLYELALGPDGALPEGDAAVSELALTGDFTADPDAFNANGIEVAADGTLIIVKAGTGELFTVDPETGETALIDLGGETVVNGDGLLLDGSTLYVVQNMKNQIAVVQLADDLSSGEITGTLTSPDFDIPTTVAEIDGALYLVNARFGTEMTADTTYDIVRVEP